MVLYCWTMLTVLVIKMIYQHVSMEVGRVQPVAMTILESTAVLYIAKKKYLGGGGSELRQ
jgi:hypothetical protein